MTPQRPRLGSLCTGAAGLDMAVVDVFDAETAWHCELDPAALRVLAHRFPDVPNLGDLTAVDWDAVEPVDILTAGYPCQPFSAAGKRKGSDDERHLWPHVAEAVRRMRPRLAVFENVAGHRSLGFDRVLCDLAAARYDVRWASVRASDVGAPHRRERLFIVATDARGEAVGLRAGLRQGESGRKRRGRLDDDAASTTADSGGGARGTSSGQRRGPGEASGSGPAGFDRGRRVLPTDPGGEGLQGRAASTSGLPPQLATDRSAAPADAASDGRDEGRPESARLVRRPNAAVSSAAAAERGLVQVDEFEGAEVEPGLLLDRVAVGRPIARDQVGADRVERGTHGGLDHGGGLVCRGGCENGECGHGATIAAGIADVNSRQERVSWGTYAAAIHRWERTLGRTAPPPTEPNTRGTGQRLNPRFVEWMMGWPAGWVTGVPGISRNDKLKICGNGVVPQQATYALRLIIAAEPLGRAS